MEPQASTSTQKPRRRSPLLQACYTDNVELISQAISLPSAPQDVLHQAVRQAIRKRATKVLTYLLENGAEVPTDSNLPVDVEEAPSTVIHYPSIAILEILLAHGWDINARRFQSEPFLWGIIYDEELVVWSLNHGATVIPKDLQLTDDRRVSDQLYGCVPILEKAAANCTVTLFELLRSHGGQPSKRMLHFAARRAIKSDGSQTEEEYRERMAMVVHLVDTLKVDPNALDQPAGYRLGNHWGTPLCYVARSNSNWDCSEVVNFLLDRGADPDLVNSYGESAIDLAKGCNNWRFPQVVEDWKAQQKSL